MKYRYCFLRNTSVLGAAFFVYITGICLTSSAAQGDFRNNLLKNYLFYEAFSEERGNATALSLACGEISSLISSAPVISENWLESLVGEGVLISAYLRSTSGEVTPGIPFKPDEKARSGFRIAADGLLHYNLVLQKPALFLEAVIDIGYLKKARQFTSRKKSLLFLSDPESGEHIIISGDESLLPYRTDVFGGEHAFILRGLELLIRTVVPGTGLELFSVYRFPLGRRSLHLFGLIGLSIFAIIVIVWIIRGVRIIREPGGERAMVSEDEEKKTDVISEIDREISDIIEEMGNFAPGEKAPEKMQKLEERQSELEKDGIFIKK